MLNTRVFTHTARIPAKQRGATLLVTLIVLVGMMLASISLIRSVDTANIVAGNLSFQQAATHSGDAGVEAAVAWLEANAGGALWNDNQVAGYHASIGSPGAGQSWDDYWNNVLRPWGVITLPQDVAGDTVSYTIHRICPGPGDPMSPSNPCASSTQMVAAAAGATSQGAGQTALIPVTQQFYRVTVQIQGPRNTLSYVQAVVVL